MIRKLLVACLFLLSTTALRSSVYIANFLNNTRQDLLVEYGTPANIFADIGPNPTDPRCANDAQTALLHQGIYINFRKNAGWNVFLRSGVSFPFIGAYIPSYNNPYPHLSHEQWIKQLEDERAGFGGITLRSGMNGSFFDVGEIASIAILDGYLYKRTGPQKHVLTKVFNEKLPDGARYVLEVRQCSDEIYGPDEMTRANRGVLHTTGSGHFRINSNAFEVVFTKV